MNTPKENPQEESSVRDAIADVLNTNIPNNFWEVVDEFRLDMVGFGNERPTIDSWIYAMENLADEEPGSEERKERISRSAYPKKIEPLLDWPSQNITFLIKVLRKIQVSGDTSSKPDLNNI